jgi:hypothetical protein
MLTGDPWFDDFAGRIPRSMHDEFAAAVVENEKIVETENYLAMIQAARRWGGY